MTGRRVLWVVAAVLAVALAVYAVLLLNRGDTESASAFPEDADGIAFVDEAVVYDELGPMTASADLVVRGTVEAARRGITHRYPPSEALADEVDRLLTVRVDETVFPAGASPGRKISIVEGWWSEGVGYAVEGVPWAEPGDEGWFYLVADPGYREGTYTYIGSVGRVLETEAGVTVSGDDQGDGPWDDRVAGRPGQAPELHDASGRVRPAAVEAAIPAAVESARSGDVQPVPRPRTTG